MNQMNQIGINKQQKTQKNTKKINFVIFVKSVGKITHCASHLVHPVRLVTKKKIRVLRVIRWQEKRNSLLKHKLIINLKNIKL